LECVEFAYTLGYCTIFHVYGWGLKNNKCTMLNVTLKKNKMLEAQIEGMDGAI
jgi:hypothetical protein